MRLNRKLAWSLAVGLLLFTPLARGQEAAPAIITDICASPKFDALLAAIACKRDKCPDADGSKDALYQRACTEVDAETANEIAVGIRGSDDGNFNTQRTVLRRVNDYYDVIEVLDTTRTEKPVKYKTLPPCDCLAKIAARTGCKIELCPAEPPPAIPPANPPAANEPEKVDKDVTPGKADSSLQGGSFCSLSPQSTAGGSLLGWWTSLGGSILGLAARRRRAKS